MIGNYAKFCIGLHIQRDRAAGTITVDQSHYISKLLTKFNMEESKTVDTPMVAGTLLTDADMPTPGSEEHTHMQSVPYRELVGALLYAQHTRPDIAFAVSVVARYMHNPGIKHWQAAQRILKFLKGTITQGITFHATVALSLFAMCDADWAAHTETRRSQTGIAIFLCGAVICVISTQQKAVALSTAEAESVCTSDCVKEVTHLRAILAEIPGAEQHGATTVFQDNQACIALAKSGQENKHRRHVDIRMKYVIEQVQKRAVQLTYISTKRQIADVLTKALYATQFKYCAARLLGLEHATEHPSQ